MIKVKPFKCESIADAKTSFNTIEKILLGVNQSIEDFPTSKFLPTKNQQVLFDNLGALGGTPNFVWDNSTKKLTVASSLITGFSSSTVGQVIKAAAAQAANLTEWQHSSGTVLTAVSAAGAIGISTSSPRGIFDFVGSNPVAYFGHDTNNAGTNTLYFSHHTNSNQQKIAIITKATGGFGQGSLFFCVNGDASGTNVTEADARFTILSTGVIQIPGALSIGTLIAPYDRFEVVGINDGSDTFVRINGDGIVGLRFSHKEAVSQQKVAIMVPAVGAFGRGTGYYFTINGNNDGANATTADAKLIIFEDGGVLVNGFAAAVVGLSIKGAAAQTANLSQWQNSAGTVLSAVDKNGAFVPSSMSNATAVNNTVYYSTDVSKLVYKDAGGTVNNLY